VSRHVWDTLKFTVDCCVKNGLEFDLATAFVGYVLEKLRQEGHGRLGGRQFLITYSLAAKWILEAANRSKHRYSRGKNATNYRLAGRRVIESLAARYGLENNPPAEVVWDWIREPSK
jgi:hypothetical protein